MPLTSTHPDDDRQLVFTSSQAARYVGVSLATIRRWTDAGHISCYRTPGGQRRFSRDQLDGFIASMHRDAPSNRSAPARSENGQHERNGQHKLNGQHERTGHNVRAIVS